MLIFIFMVLFHISGVISIFHALSRTRTSQGAIAWLISLITIPYIAVPAYWILGRSKFRNYVLARKIKNEQHEDLLQSVVNSLAPYRSKKSAERQILVGAEKLATLPITKENYTELLIDGEATFDSIMAGIDHAEDYILVQFYIIKDDRLGQRLRQHLFAKSKQGLKIYVLYDEVGSNSTARSYFQAYRDEGINIRPFNTRKGFMNRLQLNFRNHRKIVIVDGKQAWIGGHNVGDEYMGEDPEFGHWRDTHTLIEGPAVISAQLSFAEDWHWAAEEKLERLNWQPTPTQKTAESDVLIVPSGPADNLETASLIYLKAINQAQKRVWIASPYFVPDEAFIYALQLAGLRNVDVRILIPEKPDHYLVYMAAYAFIKPASLTGVKFYRYTKGFLHEKVILVDDDISIIGTANFDNRSFRLNFEVSACIINAQMAQQVEAMFEEDFANSTIMDPDILAQKNRWFRFQVTLARLASPVL